MVKFCFAKKFILMLYYEGLLVSARFHGYNRTKKQIIRVVRVCEATLRKRFVILCEYAFHLSLALNASDYKYKKLGNIKLISSLISYCAAGYRLIDN